MNSVFSNKIEYLAFKKAWAATFNSERRSELKHHHFALYAILRRCNWLLGYTPVTNKKRIECQGRFPYDTAWRAISLLLDYMAPLEIDEIVHTVGRLTYAELRKKRQEELLAPFGKTVTAEQARAALNGVAKPTGEHPQPYKEQAVAT